jgi:hypothetical protein
MAVDICWPDKATTILLLPSALNESSAKVVAPKNIVVS